MPSARPVGRTALVGLLVLALGLVGCQSGADEDPEQDDQPTSTVSSTDDQSDQSSPAAAATGDDSTAAEGEPRPGGELVMANGTTATTLNPFRFRSRDEHIRIMQMYNTLVEYNLDDLSLQPALADSWQVSEDGMTISMALRDDVLFHDGTDFLAEDAKYSIDQARDPAADELAPLLTSIDSVEVTGDHGLDILLSAPDRTVTEALTKVYIAPNDPDIDYDAEPVGTGPFMLSEWNPNENMTFVRNEDYWREGLPYLDSVVFQVVPDPSTQVLQLTNGEVDMVVPRVPFTNVEQLEDAGMQLPFIDIGIYDLRLNTRVEPWDDQRARQALSYAIDREAIAQALLGYMTVGSTIVLPDDENFNPDAPTFHERDLDTARDLLAEAGYEDGAEGSLMLHSGISPAYEIIAQVIKENAAEVGIELSIESVDIGTWLERFYEQQDFNIGFSSFTTDPYAFAAISEGWDQSDGAAMGWIDDQPEFRELLDSTASLVDDTDYQEALFELQQQGQEGQARIVIGRANEGPGLQTSVRGFTTDPLFRLFLEDVWLDQ